MTDAGWTATKPTEAGWYWFRTEVTEEEICRIYQDADDVWWATCTEWDEVYKLDDVLIGAEFLGPLSPSTYHQGRVAGLKCVRREITALGERTFTDCEEDMDDLTEWLDFQLEQQAQGGGE